MVLRIRSNLETTRVDIDDSATIEDLVKKIMQVLNIKCDTIVLAEDSNFANRFSRPSARLSELGIKHGAILYICGKFERKTVAKSYIDENGDVVPAGSYLEQIEKPIEIEKPGELDLRKEHVITPDVEKNGKLAEMAPVPVAEPKKKLESLVSQSKTIAPIAPAEVPASLTDMEQEEYYVRTPDAVKRMKLIDNTPQMNDAPLMPIEERQELMQLEQHLRQAGLRETEIEQEVRARQDELMAMRLQREGEGMRMGHHLGRIIRPGALPQQQMNYLPMNRPLMYTGNEYDTIQNLEAMFNDLSPVKGKPQNSGAHNKSKAPSQPQMTERKETQQKESAAHRAPVAKGPAIKVEQGQPTGAASKPVKPAVVTSAPYQDARRRPSQEDWSAVDEYMEEEAAAKQQKQQPRRYETNYSSNDEAHHPSYSAQRAMKKADPLRSAGLNIAGSASSLPGRPPVAGSSGIADRHVKPSSIPTAAKRKEDPLTGQAVPMLSLKNSGYQPMSSYTSTSARSGSSGNVAASSSEQPDSDRRNSRPSSESSSLNRSGQHAVGAAQHGAEAVSKDKKHSGSSSSSRPLMDSKSEDRLAGLSVRPAVSEQRRSGSKADPISLLDSPPPQQQQPKAFREVVKPEAASSSSAPRRSGAHASSASVAKHSSHRTYDEDMDPELAYAIKLSMQEAANAADIDSEHSHRKPAASHHHKVQKSAAASAQPSGRSQSQHSPRGNDGVAAHAEKKFNARSPKKSAAAKIDGHTKAKESKVAEGVKAEETDVSRRDKVEAEYQRFQSDMKKREIERGKQIRTIRGDSYHSSAAAAGGRGKELNESLDREMLDMVLAQSLQESLDGASADRSGNDDDRMDVVEEEEDGWRAPPPMRPQPAAAKTPQTKNTGYQRRHVIQRSNGREEVMEEVNHGGHQQQQQYSYKKHVTNAQPSRQVPREPVVEYDEEDELLAKALQESLNEV